MNKQLKFTFEDNDYILEYTRKTVAQMERAGFDANELATKPMTTLPALFDGAFLSKHKFVKKEVKDRIFAKLTNKAELLDKLIEMYNEPFNTLLEEPSDDEGNVEWTASF